MPKIMMNIPDIFSKIDWFVMNNLPREVIDAPIIIKTIEKPIQKPRDL